MTIRIHYFVATVPMNQNRYKSTFKWARGEKIQEIRKRRRLFFQTENIGSVVGRRTRGAFCFSGAECTSAAGSPSSSSAEKRRLGLWSAVSGGMQQRRTAFRPAATSMPGRGPYTRHPGSSDSGVSFGRLSRVFAKPNFNK